MDCPRWSEADPAWGRYCTTHRRNLDTCNGCGERFASPQALDEHLRATGIGITCFVG